MRSTSGSPRISELWPGIPWKSTAIGPTIPASWRPPSSTSFNRAASFSASRITQQAQHARESRAFALRDGGLMLRRRVVEWICGYLVFVFVDDITRSPRRYHFDDATVRFQNRLRLANLREMLCRSSLEPADGLRLSMRPPRA